jgi:hypothetical protein
MIYKLAHIIASKFWTLEIGTSTWFCKDCYMESPQASREGKYTHLHLQHQYRRCPAGYAVVKAHQNLLKSLFHSSQKPTHKHAATTFIQSQYLKALAASLLLRWGFRLGDGKPQIKLLKLNYKLYLKCDSADLRLWKPGCRRHLYIHHICFYCTMILS